MKTISGPVVQVLEKGDAVFDAVAALANRADFTYFIHELCDWTSLQHETVPHAVDRTEMVVLGRKIVWFTHDLATIVAKIAIVVVRQPHTIDNFSDQDWEEIASLGFEPFTIEPGQALTRQQWMAVAHMALGKAQRIENGDYGEDVDNGWADQLRLIAETITDHFRPGDGNL